MVTSRSKLQARSADAEGAPPLRQRSAPTAPPIRQDTAEPPLREPVTLATLKRATDRCRECPIGFNATQSVVGEGPPDAPLMLVGEQPGDQEDLRGRPFVGPAGQLLDRALAQLGWPREAVYVTNAVKHFKFELRGKRRIHKTPAQQEAAACLHWLESEIGWVEPEALVALGATAARSLLGRAVPVMKERGQWLEREDGRRVLITLHPSALLRLQGPEREAAYALWLEDLRHAAQFVEKRPRAIGGR
jgi:DNA polymerase